MSVRGIPDLSLSVPIGTVEADVERWRRDGRLAPEQAVNGPTRPSPAFAVAIRGGTLTGTSEARRPASHVTGRRRTVRLAGDR